MEKKSKKSILIGITCLFLVMILLLGLTYAYYRTRIIGNESTAPSINVTSKNTEITYTDGTSSMNMEGLIEPGFEASKTFTVTNTGNVATNFAIVLDNVINEYERTEDWTWTLTSEDETKTGTITRHSYQTLVAETSIESNTSKTYTLTVNYAKLDEVDQSIDMNKKIEMRVNIDEIPVYLTAQELLATKDSNNKITLTSDTVLTTKMEIDEVNEIDLNGFTLTLDPDKTTTGYQGAYPIEIKDNLIISNGRILRGEQLTMGTLLIAYDNVNLELNDVIIDGNNIQVSGTNGLAINYRSGAVWCSNCASLVVNNSEIKNSYGKFNGTGILAMNADELIVNNTKIYNNHLNAATQNGGIAVYALNIENVALQNSIFENNIGNEQSLGTVSLQNCNNFTFDENSIIRNNVTNEAGGLIVGTSSGTISGTIEENKTTAVDGNGGGIYTNLGNSANIVTITETAIIRKNTAAAGGGIYVNGPTNGVVPGLVKMTGGSFTENIAKGTPASGTLKDGGGAGIYVARGIMEISGGIVENNISRSNIGNAIIVSNTGKNTAGGKLTITGGTIKGSVEVAENYGTLTLENVTQNGDVIS